MGRHRPDRLTMLGPAHTLDVLCLGRWSSPRADTAQPNYLPRPTVPCLIGLVPGLPVRYGPCRPFGHQY